MTWFLQNEARSTVCKMLDELNFGQAEPVVRVNSVNSGLAEEDLKVTLSANNLPKTLMLPKVEDVEQINWVSSILLVFPMYPPSSSSKVRIITQVSK